VINLAVKAFLYREEFKTFKKEAKEGRTQLELLKELNL
jgi:hypothetical protein